MKHRQGRRSVLSPEVISGIRRATAGVLAGALMIPEIKDYIIKATITAAEPQEVSVVGTVTI